MHFYQKNHRCGVWIYIEKFSMRKINLSSSLSLLAILSFPRFVKVHEIFLSSSFSPYFRIYPILAVDVFSLALSEHRYVEVRCFATVRESWSSSRDEDHDSRDAEVELAEKKRGARAGSFFCPFHFFSVILFVAQISLTTLYLIFSFSFQFHIREIFFIY